MPWPVHPTGFFGTGGDSDSYRIERSLRFNPTDDANLTRTLGTATDQDVFTFSAWFKTDAGTNGGSIFSTSTNDRLTFIGNSINLTLNGAGVLTTNEDYKDPAAWYHIVWSQNINAHTIYINGETVSTATSTSTAFNTAIAHTIGKSGVLRFAGYLAEIHFVDGNALTPSSFGQADSITGRWKAKRYIGSSYGNNGFYLNFSDNSDTTSTALGKDSSGNGNNWTLNNFSVAAGADNDSLVDTPTNYGTNAELGGEVRGNYATLNPLTGPETSTPIDGNLRPSDDGAAISTIGMSYGKWYAEMTVVAVGTLSDFGVHTGETFFLNGYVGRTASGYSYSSDGKKYNDGTGANYGATYTSGDIIGCAFDADDGTVTFYKNGVSQGTAFTGLTGKTYFFGIYGRSTATANNVYVNFGQRPFVHQPPAGHKVLCSQVLSRPIIQNPTKYVDVLTYTGTGASNSISNFDFGPDLVWIKSRSAGNNHAIYDSTRGSQQQLSSNTNGDEVTSSTGLLSFDSNGFTLGTSSLVNTSGTQYVSWAWDKSKASGLDIISYTGNGASRTISHNLGVAPKMIIVKARTTAGADQVWPVWHTSIANTTYLTLSTTLATASGTDYWDSTSPTSSVFSVGTNAAVNANNDTYIAYAFSEVDGFSKFGSYTGDGQTDGPFIWCGFRPAILFIKKTSGTGDWRICDNRRDGYNPTNRPLFANNSNSDAFGSNFANLLSNGFKITTTETSTNLDGANYAFAAFAEASFKYARAR